MNRALQSAQNFENRRKMKIIMDRWSIYVEISKIEKQIDLRLISRNFQKWRQLSLISARKRANAESLLKRRNSELLSQYIQIWRTNAHNSAEQKFYLSKMVEKASNFSKSKILENASSNLFRFIEVKRESERRQRVLWTENQGRLSMTLFFTSCVRRTFFWIMKTSWQPNKA